MDQTLLPPLPQPDRPGCQFISVARLAEFLGVAGCTIQRASRRDPNFPRIIRVGGKLLLPIGAVHRYLLDQQAGTAVVQR